MKEEQLKPIPEENLKELNLPKKIEEETKTQEKQTTINSLPSWSIEPPIEIKRGK